MEEVNLFLRLLYKHRFTIIIVTILAVLITFFLVRNMPDSYISQAQISTGIVDETQNILSTDGGVGVNEISQEFSNLVEMMRLKKLLDQVSYQLIIHDLTSKDPFRSTNKVRAGMSAADMKAAVKTFQDNYKNTVGLNLWNKDQNKLYEMLRTMGYDSESLKAKLRIGRAGDSDFINVEFESENPELSAFVANTLSTEFIKYYTVLVKTNQLKANTFLGNLLHERKQYLDEKVLTLRNYKVANRVLNLNEQSSQLYEQILSFGNRRQEVIEGIAAKAGALSQIDRKFNPRERGYLESTLTKVNQDIMGTREDLRNLYDRSIESDFDPRYQQSIDSLKLILGSQINASTDQYIYNPLVSKQALVEQKLRMEIDLDLAKYGMNSMERQLKALNAEFDKLVPHEADVQSMERDVEVASKEYLDILDKYNQSSLESAFSVKLKFIQQAMPGLAQASKKMLLIILSGVITLAFCVIIIFILFFLDKKIRTSRELANRTQLPVLGFLRSMTGSAVDLEKIWKADAKDLPLKEFKNQLRSIRFEIENEFKDKVLVITSLKEGEGKSLLTLSLAYAWKMTNKRILIIDGNFQSGHISKSITPLMYLEDYFTGKIRLSDLPIRSSFEFMANRGGDLSIFEIVNEEVIRAKLNDLRNVFDIIIIETAALDQMNLSKEWILFGDSVVGVFEFGQTINEEKKQNISFLQVLGKRYAGWVLNKVPSERI